MMATAPTVIDGLLDFLAPIIARVRTDDHVEKVAKRQRWTHTPLTKADLVAHLDGGPAIGACPMRPGETTTRLAILDLDSHRDEMPWAGVCAAARRIMAALEDDLLLAHPYRSSGGAGIHLILMWETPQDAYSVRCALRAALATAGYRDGTGGLAKSHVEVFPKQNRISVGEFGSQIILPFTGKSRPLDHGPGATDQAPSLAVLPREAVLDPSSGLAWRMSAPVTAVEQRERSLAEGSTALTIAPGDAGLAQLESALAAIPNDGAGLDYDEWWRLITAIHHATGGSPEGLALAHAFSVRSAKYDGEFLDQRVWPYIRHHHERPITVGTILAAVRMAGWNDTPIAAFDDLSASADVADLGGAAGGTMGGAPLPMPPGLTRSKAGKIQATIANLAVLLDRPDLCGMQLAEDGFLGAIVARDHDAPGDAPWRRFEDLDYHHLRAHLERCGAMPWSKEILHGQVAATARLARFDSAQDWLDTLTWDGVDRVESFAAAYLGADDSPYTRALGLYLWSALAGRIISPGCKADMVPILVGPQGAGKSRAIAAIAPSSDAYCEISLDTKDDDLARLIAGKLIGEISELRGLKSREAEHIKAFVSRQVDERVEKYKEFTLRRPRRIVMIGTTNEDAFLADRTGNRRWLPLRVGQIDVDRIEADREQLWAEAAALYRAGGIEYRDVEDLAREGEITQDYEVDDSWPALVARWLDAGDSVTAKPRSAPYLLSADVLLGALGIEARAAKRQDEMRLGQAMRDLGYARRRRWVGESRARVYEPIAAPGDGS